MQWTHILCHHTGAWEKDTKQVRDYHINGRGWSDIGYHFVVEYNGKVVDGRPLTRKGAHSIEANSFAIGIACLGNYEESNMGNSQYEGLIKKCTELCQQYNIPVENIQRHKDWSPTVCPGKFFDIEIVKHGVRERLKNVVYKAVKVNVGDKVYFGELKDGRTLVHVRVLEEFGLKVHWDGKEVWIKN